MNTPAHVVLNLALLSGGARSGDAGHGDRPARPILAGAVLPDLPMLFFYLWEKVVLGTPEMLIWRERYFEPAWQSFIDAFNSLPLFAVCLGVALLARRRAAALFCGSALLHVLTDLPLHREDAHAHFFPFTDWRFVSPVSYWDPGHYGAWASLGEGLVTLACTVWLWPRFPSRVARISLVTVNALYAAVWLGFYAR